LSPEMCIVVVSRRFACAGRQQSWVRYGKSPGHHRGLRAGHVFTGGTRERGRATGLLDDVPGVGDRVTKSPGGILGAFPEVPSPEGTPRTMEARKVSGSERQVKRPERGTVAVVASHSTGKRGEPRPKGPTGGKATSSRAFQWVRYTRETLCSLIVSPDPHWTAPGAAVALLEEPYAFIAHVRVCGGAGWVTIGSTRHVAAEKASI